MFFYVCVYKDGTGGGKAEQVKSTGEKKSWLAVELLILALFSHLLFIISSPVSSSFI